MQRKNQDDPIQQAQCAVSSKTKTYRALFFFIILFEVVIGLCDVYVLFLVEQKVNKEELIPCLQAGSDGASNSEKEENNCG